MCDAFAHHSLLLLVPFWQSVFEPCSKAELMSFLVGETFLDGFCHADLLFWPPTCLASTAPQSQWCIVFRLSFHHRDYNLQVEDMLRPQILVVKLVRNCLVSDLVSYYLKKFFYWENSKAIWRSFPDFWGFPGGSAGKEPACQCRRCKFDPWVGKIPWRRKCNPPQCTCLGNPMYRATW